MTSTKKNLCNALLLLLLISMAVLSRYVLVDIPNFKPVAAVAMFVAFWFRSYVVAGLALVLVMLVSNVGFDHCPWQITIGVISGLLAAALLGKRLALRFSDSKSVSQQPVRAVMGLAGSAVVMSSIFFFVSNFAVWSMGQWYPLTGAGLLHCFGAAVPFFKYTLCGDLFFTGAIFSTWYAIESATSVQHGSVIDVDRA